jgi:hypothetical protein
MEHVELFAVDMKKVYGDEDRKAERLDQLYSYIHGILDSILSKVRPGPGAGPNQALGGLLTPGDP